MTFPVYFNIFGLRILSHTVMEIIAYAGGFQIYLALRRRWKIPSAQIPFERTMWIIVGAIFGALFGSKLLAWLESWPIYWEHRHDVSALLGGKTIVGGLLGGWVGVEIAKHFLAVKQSTGDVFVFPLIFGMAVGRIGCFLTGLPDHTYGIPTSLPWGVDFGDGIRRHPTQIYEMIFLIALGAVLCMRWNRNTTNGTLFRRFMLGYLAMRFAIEFIKPTYRPYLGISAIQLACVLGVAVCIKQLHEILRRNVESSIATQGHSAIEVS